MLPSSEWRVDASYSNALHTCREWSPSPTEDFSGNRMEPAPRELINGRVTYMPTWLNDSRLGLEWVRVGRYFTDAQNTNEYEGHSLLNLRLNLLLTRRLAIMGHAKQPAGRALRRGCIVQQLPGCRVLAGKGPLVAARRSALLAALGGGR
jgi:hypothetical protein